MEEPTSSTPGSTPPPPPSNEPAWTAQNQPGVQRSEGLDPKVAGLLSYLLGWIGGLVIYLTQKNPEVRFHGAQSILLSIALAIAYIALMVLSFILPFGFLDFVLFVLLWIGALALWVVMCIKGYNLEHFKLPVIGDIAESWAAK